LTQSFPLFYFEVSLARPDPPVSTCAANLFAAVRMEESAKLVGTAMPILKIAYIEFPALEIEASKTFYANLFGWTIQDYGPTYAAFSDSGTDGGLNADPTERPGAPLPVIESENLEQIEQNILKAGGKITLPIFSFPGGRRFHFTDPADNELAVMQRD
jgi:predicted enzyme related to lactoylglutathione lyase